MSGRASFFASEEVIKVDLDDAFWVEIKQELDYGEESELEGAAIKAGIDAKGQPTMEYSLKQLRSLKLALYITDWNLVGPNGKVVALPTSIARRQEIVNHLRASWANRIVAWIDRVRAEQQATEAISLVNVDDAEKNPTLPGDAQETAPPSSSVSGGDVPTGTFSAPPIVSFAARSS